MKVKLIAGLMLFALIFTTVSFFPRVSGAGNEIYVNDDYFGYSDGSAEKPYQTISEAINKAQDGDTIYVFSGRYVENLEIDKKVKIVGGIDEEETIVDSSFDRRYLAEIVADEVTIEGITFSDAITSMTSPIGALLAISSDNNRIVRNNFDQNCGYGIYISSSADDNLISNNIINGTKQGINIASSSTNDLANNIIRNCSEYGINMDSSGGNNRLYSNSIENSPYGIYVENSENVNLTYNEITNSEYYAIFISDSSDATITNNLLHNNDGDGFYLSSVNCYLKNNTLKENKRGITLVGSNNIVKNNTIRYSSASGIYIHPGSTGNTLYLNKFHNNAPSATDKGNNIWYYQNKGNYWDDYNNIDKNLDGIGDAFYSKNGVIDKYPIGIFLKPPNKPSEPIPEDEESDVSLAVTLKVHVTDPDGDDMTVSFYNADTDEMISSEKVQNDSNAECSFTLGFHRTFAWYAVANDSLLQNTSDTFFFYTQKTPPTNIPPVAVADVPVSAEAKDKIYFDASTSYDPDGEIDFYRWNFGDGTSEILKKNTSHTFEKEDTYEVTLTVIDNNGSSNTDIREITVGPYTNHPPVASMNIPTTVYTGEEIKLESTSTDPDHNDEIRNYTWEFDNQKYYTKDVYHIFSTPGEYIITLQVDDGQETNQTMVKINVENKQIEETPGFEIIVFLTSLLFALIILRKKVK